MARRQFLTMPEDPRKAPGEGLYWTLLRRLEGAVIQGALSRARGNQIEAARLLGINRNTLRKKVTDFEFAAAGRTL